MNIPNNHDDYHIRNCSHGHHEYRLRPVCAHCGMVFDPPDPGNEGSPGSSSFQLPDGSLCSSPDWEAFGRAVAEKVLWPDYFDLDAGDAFELARKHFLIREVPGGFDPQIHLGIEDDFEPGDPLFVYNFNPQK